MSFHDYITLIAAFVGSSGLFGGLYLLMKLRPEAGSIVVKSAEGVVLMQSGLIKKLEDRIADLEKEAAEFRITIHTLQKSLGEAERLLAEFRGFQKTHDEEIRILGEAAAIRTQGATGKDGGAGVTGVTGATGPAGNGNGK